MTTPTVVRWKAREEDLNGGLIRSERRNKIVTEKDVLTYAR